MLYDTPCFNTKLQNNKKLYIIIQVHRIVKIKGTLNGKSMKNSHFPILSYPEVEEKYIRANIKHHYLFENAAEVEEVLGIEIRRIDGFEDLSLKHQNLAEILVIDFINGFGLEYREIINPVKIELFNNDFKLTFIEGNYSLLSFNGDVH
jgi:hypothetical protein